MNNHYLSGIHFSGQMCSLRVKKDSSREYELLKCIGMPIITLGLMYKNE